MVTLQHLLVESNSITFFSFEFCSIVSIPKKTRWMWERILVSVAIFNPIYFYLSTSKTKLTHEKGIDFRHNTGH